MAFPQTRMRRLRSTASLRGLVRETELRAGQLVLPLFVSEASPMELVPRADRDDARTSIACRSRPLLEEAREAAELGIAGVMLFGIPAEKDAEGSRRVGRGGRRCRPPSRAIKRRCPSCS